MIITNACMVRIFLVLPFHLQFSPLRPICEHENALGYTEELTSALSCLCNLQHWQVMIFLIFFPEYLKIPFGYFRKSIHNIENACLTILHLLFILYKLHSLADMVMCCWFIIHFHMPLGFFYVLNLKQDTNTQDSKWLRKKKVDSDNKTSCLCTKKFSQQDIKKTGCGKYPLQGKTKSEQFSHLFLGTTVMQHFAAN